MKNKRPEGYSSKKHPVLEHIFKKYYKAGTNQKIIPFYLSDISEGYSICRIKEPVSISNTILDLCRQNRGIDSRVPKSISSLGYDLRKRTGFADDRDYKYAGEFVFVGVGNELKSWLIWPEKFETLEIDSSSIPSEVTPFIRPDEGGLFSIIDYCDILTKVIWDGKHKVHRVQNPMKWQPNEIDGFYTSKIGEQTYVFPIEAKALTTQDAINMDQFKGEHAVVVYKMKKIGFSDVHIQSIALRMTKNAINIAIFKVDEPPDTPMRVVKVIFRPEIKNWT